MSFCDELERRTAGEREAMMSHPFVLGIGDGSLAPAKFRHFMIQDFLFLIDYARALAMGAAKAPGSQYDGVVCIGGLTTY